MLQGESIVRLGGSGVSSCGYCQSYGFSSHGCMAEKLTVQDYQDMIDRGWRRSGKYIYKPKMDETCCPQYTIRLRSQDFVANKEQEKVVKKMQKYLDGGQKGKDKEERSNNNNCNNNNNVGMEQDVVQEEEEELIHSNVLQQLIRDAANQLIEQNVLSQECRVQELILMSSRKGKRKGVDANKVMFTCPIGFKLHRFLVLRNGLQIPSQVQGRTRLIADAILQIISPQLQDGWIAYSQNGHLNFHNELLQQQWDQRHDSSTKQNKAVETEQTEVQQSVYQFEVIEVPSEYIEEEYQLYKKYQMNTHGDDEWELSPSSYRRFLVDSPLISVDSQGGGGGSPSKGYGSFHHQYRIDGRLVAVGVVDVLPRCLSSVYFFWDPEYAHLSLGKYSAINEIKWVQDVSKTCPQLQYYYLGYYIQSCHKMRYKGDYKPCQLLCPLNFKWVNLTDEVAKALTENRYCVLSQLQNSEQVVENGNNQEGSSQFCLEQRALTQIPPAVIVDKTQLKVDTMGRLSCSELLQMGLLRSPKRFLEAIQEWHTLAGPAAERILLSI